MRRAGIRIYIKKNEARAHLKSDKARRRKRERENKDSRSHGIGAKARGPLPAGRARKRPARDSCAHCAVYVQRATIAEGTGGEKKGGGQNEREALSVSRVKLL